MTRALANIQDMAQLLGSDLEKSGHEFVFTTREHPDTLPLIKFSEKNPSS